MPINISVSFPEKCVYFYSSTDVQPTVFHKVIGGIEMQKGENQCNIE